ncbi:hypothetical protein KHQ82_03395 [Mycoplasmatota bacterium]|nr:hypothetical protein KHQ82_03395 [Mycoplasmatota bacterium]
MLIKFIKGIGLIVGFVGLLYILWNTLLGSGIIEREVTETMYQEETGVMRTFLSNGYQLGADEVAHRLHKTDNYVLFEDVTYGYLLFDFNENEVGSFCVTPEVDGYQKSFHIIYDYENDIISLVYKQIDNEGVYELDVFHTFQDELIKVNKNNLNEEYKLYSAHEIGSMMANYKNNFLNEIEYLGVSLQELIQAEITVTETVKYGKEE